MKERKIGEVVKKVNGGLGDHKIRIEPAGRIEGYLVDGDGERLTTDTAFVKGEGAITISTCNDPFVGYEFEIQGAGGGAPGIYRFRLDRSRDVRKFGSDCLHFFGRLGNKRMRIEVYTCWPGKGNTDRAKAYF